MGRVETYHGTAVNPSKCRTCAYRGPVYLEDLDMAIGYHILEAKPHPCHERKNGVLCAGATVITCKIEAALSDGRLGPSLVQPEIAFAGKDLSDPASVEALHHRRLLGIAEALGFHPGEIRSRFETPVLQEGAS